MMKFVGNKKMFRSWNSILCATYEKKLAANMKLLRIIKLIRSSESSLRYCRWMKISVLISHDFCIRAFFEKLSVFLVSHIVASISSIGGSFV